MAGPVSSCAEPDLCAVEEEGRPTETDADTGEAKPRIPSAVIGTWEGAVDHRGKATTLSSGCQGMIPTGDSATSAT